MIETTFEDYRTRTFVACLIISLMVLSPLVPCASAAPRWSRPATSALSYEPASAFVPSITATKVDSFADLDGDGKATPGETITYDVNITNSGTDASDVNFTDTIDPNTTLIGGSLKVSPLAFADDYSAAKNTQLSVGAPGVLTNDTGIPNPTAVPIAGGATTQGGTVTLNADGSFVYNPVAGFEGADSFTYTATNGLTPDDTATVTINVDAAPSVVNTTPANGATNQALNTNITITFSEAVDVTGDWFQISCTTSGLRNVADTVVTGGPTTFTINPNADFVASETCTVTVFAAQISDQDTNDPPDNMNADHMFSFATLDAAPTVVNTSPANNAINQTTDTNIEVTFSEPVDVTGNWFQIVCGVSGTRNVADTVVTGGPTTFTINPNADFAAGETCTVTVFAAQVTDQDSNDPPDNMAANFVFGFSMDAAPTVNNTTPVNGATQVANNTNITITFSEAVDVAGNWFQIVGASSGTRNVADTVVTGGPTTFTINPNTDFANGELVTVTVFAAQVADQDANDPPQNMSADFVFSFTVDQSPSVTSTVPTNGAIDVLKGSNIVINFSENVNASTSSFTIECPAPGNLQTFAVSGSGTNAITLNPNADLPPGVICTVTVIANQISDTDTGDPPDNMDANFVFSFGVKPEAIDDARNATGNIRIQTASSSGFSVLANDLPMGIMVTASDTTSVRGGNVTVAANGTFTYNPPAGYEGPDSFNYTISNAAGSDVGTVNITVAGMIWFIDDNPSSGACTTNNNICGRLTNPFSSLAAFEAVNGNATPTNGSDVIAPEAGDHIFIFSGTYPGPLTLENNQRVIGQGATSSLQMLSGITPVVDSDALPLTGGTKPSITTSGFNVVSNNHVFGLAFDDTSNNAINSVANIGTMIIGDVTVLNDASNGGGIVLDDGGTSVTTTGTNSINTRSGIGLNVTNTTIGAGNLTFQTLSVGNNDANADPVNGIVLNNTGTQGGLTVSGGTIRFTTGAGVSLTSTRNINFSSFTVQNSGDDGITGLNVTNFTLSNSTISSNGNAVLERGIDITNLLGTSSITGSTLTGNAEDNLYVKNGTGTLTLTVSTTTFSNNSATIGNDGIHFLAADVSGSNNANMSITVTNSVFTNHRGDHFQATTDAATTGTQTVVFQNNDLNNTVGTNLGAGLTLNPGGNATVNFNISNNGTDADPFTGAFVSAITINSSNNSTMSGTINNNVIGNPAAIDSGSFSGDGITVFANNTSDITVAITNNKIREYSNLTGINIHVRDGASDTINATITGNTISDPGTFASNGILAQAGSVAGDTGFLCLDIGGAGALANSIAGSGANGGDDFRVRQRILTSVRLPGYAGANNNDAAVVAFIQGRNNGAETGSATNNVAGGGGGFVGGAACAAPVAMYRPSINNQQDHVARTEKTVEPSETGQSHRGASESLTQYAKRAKRDRGTVLSHSRANSWIKSPATTGMRDKMPGRAASIKPRASLSGETVNHSIGTLLAGKTVRIQFQVTVNLPFTGGSSVSNQGTLSGSNFSDVLTDDPDVGGMNDPTVTPIFTTPNVSISDAAVAEPISGTTSMLFTIALSAPATQMITITYNTADGTAVAPGDYTAVVGGMTTFQVGEQIKTIPITVNSDMDGAEANETFTVTISANPAEANVVDGTATGTITVANNPGTLLISELRTSGPAGAEDEFVEIYNNSDSPHTVTASDASTGYGIFKSGSDCDATPILVGTIPNGTIIPARGHYLLVGSTYSLANYGGTGAAAGDLTLSTEIENDRNVSIFSTTNVLALSTLNRFDAVGFGANTGNVCDLLREGTNLGAVLGSTLQYIFFRKECDFVPGMGCTTPGRPKDTNDNAADFLFADTTATLVAGAGQRLGAPGPQNLASPLNRDGIIPVLLLDMSGAKASPPNRVRDLTSDPGNNSTFGTLAIRRRVVNNSGGPVTRLRFRIIETTPEPPPGGAADLRARTGMTLMGVTVNDGMTCAATGTPMTPPCTVTVQGLTLEQPPAQAKGGGYNATLTLTLGTPLPDTSSVNVEFLLGVQQPGSFRFFVIVEALP